MSSFSEATNEQITRARQLSARTAAILANDRRKPTASASTLPGNLAELEHRAELQNTGRLQAGYLAEIEQHLDTLAHRKVSRRAQPLSYSDRGPFRNLGEQLQAVAHLALNPAGQKAREGAQLLQAVQKRAAPAGAGEQVPADGGFLVSTEIADDMAVSVYDTGKLLSRCDNRQTSKDWSTALKLPGYDEQSRADGSRFGGVRGYWINEADAVPTSTKPRYRSVELNLNKLFAVSYATEELLQDADLLTVAVQKAFVDEMVFKLEDSLINGSGAGQSLGILNSGALITVAAGTGQTSPSVVAANLTAMYAQLWSPSRARACWLVSPDAETQIIQAAIITGTAGAPAPWFHFRESDDDDNRVMGLPMYCTEYSQALGTVGDVVLADLGQYLTLEKTGPDMQTSMHVKFLTDENVFRFVWRVSGSPKMHLPVTPKVGTLQLSPYVTLAAR